MGAIISGESEEQITCDYNEKQHQSCKDTVANQENTIKNYMDMDKAKKATITELEYKISVNEKDLENTRIQYEERGNELNTEKKKVENLNNKINRIKDACNKDANCKKLTSVQNVLNEKFTPTGFSCDTLIYCIIALLLGILIGAWLFGNYNRSAQMNTVEDNTVNRVPINEVEYKPETMVNEQN